MITCYRDLEVWQLAMDLVERCYRLTQRFPQSEEYGLRSQIRRAAVSIPSNIAEGHDRTTTGEYLQQLSVARGSLAELETQVLLAGRLGYLKPEESDAVLQDAGHVGRMLTALTGRLREKAASKGGNHP